MKEKVRLFVRRTFLDGEGELRTPGAGALLAFLLGAVLVLELFSRYGAPTALYLALFGTFGYVVGQRSAAKAPVVESVAPPFIPDD